MPFLISPKIVDYKTLTDFLAEAKVGENDLIVTNEYILVPKLGGAPVPCDIIYQEKYGGAVEPTDEMIDTIIAEAKAKGKDYKRVIAIGGGAVIDIAKLLACDGDSTQAKFDKGPDLTRSRKLLVIPTTCGAGSEVTNIAVVGFKKKGTKMGLATPALFADEAVLIPDMLSALPYKVFATSSVDAMIHSVESMITPLATPFSKAMAKASIEMIVRGYMDLIKSGGAGKLPKDMAPFLAASTMGGIAFGNGGVACVHALAYPIGNDYGLAHGEANYCAFKPVFDVYKKYGVDLSELESVLAGALGCAPAKAWDELFALIDQVLPRPSLAALGCNEAKCREMAQNVIANQQRLLGRSPLPATEDLIFEMFKACL